MTLSAANRARYRALFVWRLRAAVDLTTADGRGWERQRRIAITGVASALAKAFSVGTALVTAPLTRHYLGPERYGMWMTMSSFIALMGFADLGVSNGLLSAVASASGRDDRAAIRAYVSSACGALAAIALAVTALFAVSCALFDWSTVFNVQSSLAKREAAPAMTALVLCFALAMPAGVAQKAQMGLQRGFTASLWQCGGSLLALAGVIGAVYARASLPMLVLAFAGAPILAAMLNAVMFFGRSQPELAPSWGCMSWGAVRSVAGAGLLFLALQLFGAVAYACDNIIIAQRLGAPAVAGYAVPAQMFNLIGTVVAMLSAPLWPAYREAATRGDGAWVRRVFWRSLALSAGAASAASVCLIALGPTIIALWVGGSITPTWPLLVALGVWRVVEAAGNSFAMLLNGLHVLRAQVAIASLTCVTMVLLKFALVAYLGVVGVPLGAIIAFAAVALIPYAFLLNRYLPR